MMYFYLALTALATALWAIPMGYAYGQFKEREQWNKLIDDGIIEKPKNQN